MHDKTIVLYGKKVFYIIILTFIILFHSFPITNAEDEECFSYSNKEDFDVYKQRLKCICDKYKPDRALKNIENKFNEVDGGYYLPNIKYIHKNNMNDIYKCAILAIQKKSLALVKDELINKNPDLSDSIGPKIDEKIFLITLTSSKIGCIDSNEKSSIQKLNVLKQATYETCKYVSYLEYLKKNNELVEGLTSEEKTDYTIDELFQASESRNSQLDNEIAHTYKVFPIVYHSYTEYENNIIIHFLLELLKEDYITIREKLHKTLNPINQVVYKISNAMRKE